MRICILFFGGWLRLKDLQVRLVEDGYFVEVCVCVGADSSLIRLAVVLAGSIRKEQVKRELAGNQMCVEDGLVFQKKKKKKKRNGTSLRRQKIQVKIYRPRAKEQGAT